MRFVEILDGATGRKWDAHGNRGGLIGNHRSNAARTDQGITALVEDLHQRGMLDDVLVYCAGEFGRTPMMNGHAGRDHWSNCFTTMLAGGGLKGGQVVGASEKFGGGVLQRQVIPLDLMATIYQAMGISLDTHYTDSAGRPVSIVGPGQPIHELL